MTTLAITENINLIASEETINEYTYCVNRIDMLHRAMDSAFDEHDWEDCEDYAIEIVECYDRIWNLA